MDRTTTVTTSKAGDPAVTYTFDAVGNQIRRVDATGTTTFRYDKLNRLVVKDLAAAATDCSGGPTATRPCYGWDDASNMVSLGDGRGVGGVVGFYLGGIPGSVIVERSAGVA
jgi:YD repeat-containing protein